MNEKRTKLELDADCERCGKPCQSGSTLCNVCLVIRYKDQGIKMGRLKMENRELVEKIKKLTGLCERLIDHIANDMIMNSEPYIKLRKDNAELIKGD